MPDLESTPPRHHVLLVGIDAYDQADPLFGCVNDADAIEAVLLDRIRVPAQAITKLTAPHPWHSRSPRVPEKAATSENLRAALEALAGEAVGPADRVLVYYAGHGTRLLPRGTRFVREALVPADVHAGGELLYDYELNALLDRIARRSHDLTVILDCCCSAGATRSALRPGRSAVRFCRIEDAPPAPPRATRCKDASAAPDGLLARLDPGDPGFLVAAACQSNERAHEGPGGGAHVYGAFTAALLDRLAAEPDDRLGELRWADVWQGLRERVSGGYPGQHPWLLGRAERRVFGGAFRPQDAGYPVAPAGARVRIRAGTMAGLGPGARVAIYGVTPDFFPPVGSPEDLASRLGVVEVDDATPSSCTAAPVGNVFVVEEGARARLIRPGARDALVVGMDPYDPDLARRLEAGGQFRIVAGGRTAGGIEIEAWVGIDPEGMRWIGDDLYGPEAGGGGEPPLARVRPDDPDALARALSHYAGYNLVLRLWRRSRDLPSALRVRVLDCSDLSALGPADLQDPPLPEVPADPEDRYRYLVDHGQRLCFTVENGSSARLYANALNCAASGRVEVLGATPLEIPPGRRQTFWLRGRLGAPFQCSLPASRVSGVERLVVIGTTVPDVDLSPLAQRKSFEEAIQRIDRGESTGREPAELWTATLVTMKIARAAPAPAHRPGTG